jgi:heat-inducible transcriptional repressor
MLPKVLPHEKKSVRLNQTLAALVDEYIGSVEPVSSRILNEKYLTQVSSATLRLDLMKLEQQSLICQPHTSAAGFPLSEVIVSICG